MFFAYFFTNVINDILTKDEWKDLGLKKSVYNIRAYQKKLNYSASWMTEFVFRIVLLAKKEPKPKETDNKKEK